VLSDHPTYAGIGSRATAYARRPPIPQRKVAPTCRIDKNDAKEKEGVITDE